MVQWVYHGEKKKELGVALLSFVILALITVAIVIFSIAINESLKNSGIYSVMSTITWVVLGASIGISAGFGYAIAQRLFDAFLTK